MSLRSCAKNCLVFVTLFLAAVPAAPMGIVQSKVDGDTLEAKIRLSGGIGAELAVRFEQSVGLSAESLGLSAELLSTADLATLQGRLPGNLTSVPLDFPVLVTIEPPADAGLSFSGVAEVELYTHDLLYVPGSPLRLFSAPFGGAFTDVTATAGAGSYRVRGHKGKFSEFLIVADLRPVDQVIGAKIGRLRDRLESFEPSIEPTVFDALEMLLDQAEAAWQADDLVTAIQRTEAFAATVEAASGDDIPDVWRSARDLTNVAGELRAGAATLRYSLVLKSNGAS